MKLKRKENQQPWLCLVVPRVELETLDTGMRLLLRLYSSSFNQRHLGIQRSPLAAVPTLIVAQDGMDRCYKRTTLGQGAGIEYNKKE